MRSLLDRLIEAVSINDDGVLSGSVSHESILHRPAVPRSFHRP
jgi:hypothetical protein